MGLVNRYKGLIGLSDYKSLQGLEKVTSILLQVFFCHLLCQLHLGHLLNDGKQKRK